MKHIIALLLTSALLILPSCGKAAAEPDFEFELYSIGGEYGMTFTYDGTDYDLTELAPVANAVSGTSTAGSTIIIECHVNPNMLVYLLFDAQKREFYGEISGTNLVWSGEDITTAVYSFRNEVYDYDGNMLGNVPDDAMFISDLVLSEDGGSVSVKYRDADDNECVTRFQTK